MRRALLILMHSLAGCAHSADPRDAASHADGSLADDAPDARCAPIGDAVARADGTVAATDDAAASLAGYCSPDRWCWDNPRPTGNNLRAAWQSARDDLWVVGDRGTVLHRSGATWSVTAVPTRAALVAVWAAGPRDAWAVTEALSSVDPGQVFRWDGASWVRVRPELAPAEFVAHDVWGSSATDVWIVGNSPDALHWDGASWSLRATGTTALQHVTGSAPNDVWFVPMSPTEPIQRWNGTTLTTTATLRTEADSTVEDLWVGAPDDAWAVTTHGVQQWDGAAWTWSDLGFSIEAWSASLWGTSHADVWLATPAASGPDATSVAHWDGARWSRVSTGTGRLARAFAGRGPGETWAVGDTGSVARWDGARWTTVLPPTLLTDPPDSWVALWGSSASDVWAIGARGGATARGEIWHFDGARWQFSGVRADAPLHSLWGTAADDVWAVGATGTILHWDGAAWSHVAGGSTDDLSAVWASGRDDAWVAAVNDDATRDTTSYFLHWDGCAWSVVAPALGAEFQRVLLVALGGSGPNDVWAVVDSPYPQTAVAVLHWDGHAWSPSPLGWINGGWRHQNPWFGVSALRPDDVWIAGVGSAYHWDGTAFRAYPLGVNAFSVSLWGFAHDDVWGASPEGGLFHWDGASWRGVDSGSALALHAIWGASARQLWAVGDGAAILRGTQ